MFRLIPRVNRFAAVSSQHRVMLCTTTDKAILMQNLLKKKLQSSECFVEDISGGCGSMYAIKVKSAQFNGLNKIKQHRIVHDLLTEEIGEMHGLRIQTIKDN
jgi:stress-induced morphogen